MDEEHGPPAAPGDGDTIRGRGIWEHFTIREGLPDMKIECIAEDRKGYIWVGTHDRGVARFDGEEFVNFTRRDGLAGDGVFSVLEDREGSLWFGTNRGLTRYDGTRFEVVDLPEPCGLLWGSAMDGDGNLWFGVERRPGKPATVCRWDGERAELIAIRGETEEFGESINTIAVDNHGALWLGGRALYRLGEDVEEAEVRALHALRGIEPTDNGDLLVAGQSGVWRISATGMSTPVVKMESPGANCVVSDKGWTYWLATYGGHLMRLAGGMVTDERDFRKPIQALIVDSEQCLWVGTYGMGAYRCDKDTWQVYEAGGNQKFTPRCLAVAPSSRIWVGSSDGLWASDTGGNLRMLDLPFECREVTSVCTNESGGTWIGLRNGLVAKSVDGSFEAHPRPNGVQPNRIVDLTMDRPSRTVWYSCAPGQGVGHFSDTGTGTHYGPSNSKGFPLWVSAVFYSLHRRCLFFGTAEARGNDGLWLYDGVEPRLVLSTTDRSITAIAEVAETIYLGTNGGLLLFKGGEALDVSANLTAPCDVVTCLHVDARDNLWIGTEGGGVCRFDGDTLQVVAIPGGPQFNLIHDIVTDGQGLAWIATEGGLVRYSGTARHPRVGIETVTVAGQELAPAEGISFSESARGIIVRFRAASVGRRGSLVYRYRLLGQDLSWKVSRGCAIEFDRLPRGQYTLQVCAVDRDLNYSAVSSAQIVVEADDRELLIREALATGSPQTPLIGKSEELWQVKVQLNEVARSNLTVLILGETGTGKSVAARLLHELSRRREGPFVQINCGAITESLAEAELFGHERGAFTGAFSKRVGKFQLASGGTVFLDEVGDLPMSVQAKLLHVLQDNKVEPVGSSRAQSVDVRVVAATNRDLASAVKEGQFRSDLMYRLNTFTIVIPPLRSRVADIGALAEEFAREFARHLDKPCPRITKEALMALESYEWPGNVRELEHMIQRAVVLARNGEIGPRELPIGRREGPRRVADPSFPTLRDHEKEYLRRVLKHTRGVIQGESGAAKLLNINPSTLRSRLRKLGLG